MRLTRELRAWYWVSNTHSTVECLLPAMRKHDRGELHPDLYFWDRLLVLGNWLTPRIGTWSRYREQDVRRLVRSTSVYFSAAEARRSAYQDLRRLRTALHKRQAAQRSEGYRYYQVAQWLKD